MSTIQVKKVHSFLGHTDSIYAMHPIRNGQFISSGGDGMVILWDVEMKGEGQVLAKVSSSIYAMTHDPHSDTLFIGQNNEGIHKIDLKNKKEIKSLALGNHQIFDLKIVDDILWAGLSNGEVLRLSKDLDVLDRKKVADDRIRSFDFHGNWVVVSSSDNHIRILDRKNLDKKFDLEAHKNSVFSSRFHPSGKYLISGGRDAHLKVWDTQASYVLRESIAAHLFTINDILFRPDGRYFITASMDKTVKIWDAYNFRLLKVVDKQRHSGHANSVNKLVWMDYQDLLVTCSDDRTISVWKINFAE